MEKLDVQIKQMFNPGGYLGIRRHALTFDSMAEAAAFAAGVQVGIQKPHTNLGAIELINMTTFVGQPEAPAWGVRERDSSPLAPLQSTRHKSSAEPPK